MKIWAWLACFVLIAADAGAQDAVIAKPDAAEATIPADEGEPEEAAPDEAVAPVPPVEAQHAPALSSDFNIIRLRALNKVTARAATLEGPIGTVIRFGTLEVIARRCWQAPPEAPPETAALLEIRKLQPGEGDPQTIFTGWMFASSPGLSALEDPVYDVRVLECAYQKDAE